MEGSITDLSKYRYESALDDLDTAKGLLRNGKFKASVNRSYCMMRRQSCGAMVRHI